MISHIIKITLDKLNKNDNFTHLYNPKQKLFQWIISTNLDKAILGTWQKRKEVENTVEDERQRT